MDIKDIAQNLASLEQQLEAADDRATRAIERRRAAEAELQAAMTERDSLLKIIEAIRAWRAATGNNGAGAPAGTEPKIRGREAVRRVLQEKGRSMRARDLVREVLDRGWVDEDARDPAASIRVAARRLVEDGEVVKVAEGTYRWRGTPEKLGQLTEEG